MLRILNKVQHAIQNRTTYRLGLLQSKAYRILKSRTALVLAPFGINPIEWALLGLIHDKTMVRPKYAADELGVEPPFITIMVKHLEEMKLVVQDKDVSDSRAKTLSLTDSGMRFVKETEKVVREGMRGSIKGASIADLLGYVTTLEAIIENETH